MMRPSTRPRGVGRRSLALMAIVTMAGVAVAGQQPPGESRGPARRHGPEGLRGELTIRHERVRADGTLADGSPPALVVGLEHALVGGRWRTSFVVRSGQAEQVRALNGLRTLENPFAITRVEFDDDGGPPRMFDRTGRRVEAVSAADRRLVEAAERPQVPTPVEDLLARLPLRPVGSGPRGSGLIVEAADREGRRAALERRFGQPVGRQGDLDRFVSAAGQAVQELFVSPDHQLVREVTLTENGRLISRVLFEYEPMSGQHLLRRLVQAEHEIPGTQGERQRTTIELSKVEIEESQP